MKDLASSVSSLFNFPPDRGGKKVLELRALTHGLPPKAIRKNLELFASEWAKNGVDAWNQLTESAQVFETGNESADEKKKGFGWWTLPEVVADRFVSPVLHAPAGTCIMLSNATQIVFSLLSCKELNVPSKRKVICTDGEFPAVLHTLHHFNHQFTSYPSDVRKAVQLDIRIAEMGDSAFDAEKILSEIDDNTALVIFSHIGFVRGERVPDDMIKQIVKKAHSHGALVAIDGYHALGNHALNVTELGVDMYFGGLLKEGCGSSGNCFLYIRKDLELTPSLSGWFGDKDPFAFAPSPAINPSVRRRFLTGTTPIAPLYHAVEGVKIMLQVGLENVAKDALDKVEGMTKKLVAACVTVVSPQVRDRMSSLIVLKVEEANKLRDYLEQEYAILVDARRNQFLRLAAHIYNSAEDLDTAAALIAQAVQDKKYLSMSAQKKAGPVT